MQFKFDAQQPFQLDAIAAIVDLFDGQPRVEVEVTSAALGPIPAVPNRLDLDESQWLQNLHQVQTRNGITPDQDFEWIEEEIVTAAGSLPARFANFSVEMETGTGKTYVYLRTALELYRRYGMRKFIVVVPSVAIREGVLKTLEVTAQHFRTLYQNPPYRYYVYDSASISQVRQFALSNGIEIMIMTLASFNKAANVILQSTDRLQGETPIHLVQATRPILILDEPQNMESEKSIRALASLYPLFALRYSATHRNPYNVVYRLTPYEAYRQNLVKRIEVASVIRESDTARPYVRLDRVESKKKTVTATLAVHSLMKDGTIKEQVVTVKPGDSLQAITHRTEYAGFEVDEISLAEQGIWFANGLEILVGQEFGANKAAIFEAQIRYTIEEHMRKQARLRAAGIKVLTLFFIDRVDNYAREDGLIRGLFIRAFDAVKQRYPEWSGRSAQEVQAAYFAQRQTRSGDVVLEDSKSGEAERDIQAYELIMKDKERLLSLDEPVAFIFSHSALREGWDNPNIFQICTLNQTTSEVKKRQEIGRGVRLCVDQAGTRVGDEKVNILTVVANESYERFVAQLQDEVAFEYRAEIEARYGKPVGDLSVEERRQIEQEYGAGILPPRPANAQQRHTIQLRKAYTLTPEFKALWNHIKQRTRYSVQVDSGQLVQEVVTALQGVVIAPPRVVATKAGVTVGTGNRFEAQQMSATKTVVDLSGRYALPNLVQVMANLMEQTSPRMFLTRRTLLEIVKRTPNQAAMLANPNEYASIAVRIIKQKLIAQLVAGIQYERVNDWYEMTRFEAEIESWSNFMVPANHCVYDGVTCASDVERRFVEGLERRADVRMYLKLPGWFVVDTPLGAYNPDWAIVMEDRDEHGEDTGKPLLYLVRETKGSLDKEELRIKEERKIYCGERHFEGALGVSFRAVTSADELP